MRCAPVTARTLREMLGIPRKGACMTSQADFSEQEWDQVLQGPPTAGMIVLTAQRGGTFRESFAIAKAYVEARQQHGESELLDAIVAAKPEVDRTRFHSVDELKQKGLQHLRDAAAVLGQKAPPGELEEYRRFVLASRRRWRTRTARA